MHYLAIIPWLNRDLIKDSIRNKNFKSYFGISKPDPKINNKNSYQYFAGLFNYDYEY